MKSAVILALITSVLQIKVKSAASKELFLPLDPQQEECIKELDLDREMTAYLSTQEFPPEENSSLNDFFSCTWKKQRYQNQDGQLNYSALEKMVFDALKEQAGPSRSGVSLAKQMSATAVGDCKYVRGNSHGQTGVKMQNCMYRRLLVLAKESRPLNNSEKTKQDSLE